MKSSVLVFNELDVYDNDTFTRITLIQYQLVVAYQVGSRSAYTIPGRHFREPRCHIGLHSLRLLLQSNIQHHYLGIPGSQNAEL